MTRSPDRERGLRELGAQPVVADGLDRDAVMDAVTRSAPDVVVHEMTGLNGVTSVRNFDRQFAVTNRLRTEGTNHLLGAAQTAGAPRFVAQSFGNWNYVRAGSPAKSEDEPFDANPPARQRRSLAAIRHLERAVLEAHDIDGLVLRYGTLYGPGTGIAHDGDIAAIVRKGRFPVVGDGGGVWSFIHVDDAAAATVAAIERGAPGAYNISDDEPVHVADWLPALAHALGAPRPRHVPVWVGWLAVGEVGVSMMTRIRGALNAKAKRELGWRPEYDSYGHGFRTGLGPVVSAAGARAAPESPAPAPPRSR